MAGFDPWGEPYESANDLAVAQSIAPDEFKILDFSKDNDHERTILGFTGAELKAGSLPESFTVCSAFMVEAWHTSFKESKIVNHRYTLQTFL